MLKQGLSVRQTEEFVASLTTQAGGNLDSVVLGALTTLTVTGDVRTATLLVALGTEGGRASAAPAAPGSTWSGMAGVSARATFPAAGSKYAWTVGCKSYGPWVSVKRALRMPLSSALCA